MPLRGTTNDENTVVGAGLPEGGLPVRLPWATASHSTTFRGL